LHDNGRCSTVLPIRRSTWNAQSAGPDADKPENGGLNLAPRPLETVLAGTVKLTAERVIAMSRDKYCSASIMLAKTAEITTSFELIEA